MDLNSYIGHPNPDVLIVAKGGRDFRYERMQQGLETPREFFYGFFDVEAAGIPVAMMSSAARAPGALGGIADLLERGFAAATALGVRPFSTRLALPLLNQSKAVISFTDGFSLSLGLGLRGLDRRPFLVGGFHGLSDIEQRSEVRGRPLVRRLITRALRGLDHAFFFGPADRAAAIESYGLEPERSSIINFGIDETFWRPINPVDRRDVAVAVGQDMNRDFDTLVAATGENPTHIVTRRAVAVPDGARHVTISKGDFFGTQSMSDEELRQLYNMAAVVVVPLKDVNQPTGYSVTLQAMSCARPVILSRIKGLWTHELLIDGENCLLVPPDDPTALGAAISRVRADPALAERLGRNARRTVEAHFGLDQIGFETTRLARLGLCRPEARSSAA